MDSGPKALGEVGLDDDEEADLDGSTGIPGLDDIARDVLADNDGPRLLFFSTWTEQTSSRFKLPPSDDNQQMANDC